MQLEAKLTEHYMDDSGEVTAPTGPLQAGPVSIVVQLTAAAWPMSVRTTTEETTRSSDKATYPDPNVISSSPIPSGSRPTTVPHVDVHETTTQHTTTIEIRLNRPFTDADYTIIRGIVQLIMVESVVGP